MILIYYWCSLWKAYSSSRRRAVWVRTPLGCDIINHKMFLGLQFRTHLILNIDKRSWIKKRKTIKWSVALVFNLNYSNQVDLYFWRSGSAYLLLWQLLVVITCFKKGTEVHSEWKMYIILSKVFQFTSNPMAHWKNSYFRMSLIGQCQ